MRSFVTTLPFTSPALAGGLERTSERFRQFSINSRSCVGRQTCPTSGNNGLFVSAPFLYVLLLSEQCRGFRTGCTLRAVLMGYCWSEPVPTVNDLILL